MTLDLFPTYGPVKPFHWYSGMFTLEQRQLMGLVVVLLFIGWFFFVRPRWSLRDTLNRVLRRRRR